MASLPDKCILDEVQRVPGLLPAIKLAVDGDRRPGRFLLTGSANLLLLPNVTESLAGRMEIVQLHPLTEAEKVCGPGGFVAALLSAALEPRMAAGRSEAGPTLPERLAAGGYPEPLTRSPARARQWHRQYTRSIIERDVADVAQIKDADQVARLLELLACAADSFSASARWPMNWLCTGSPWRAISPCWKGCFSCADCGHGTATRRSGSSSPQRRICWTANRRCGAADPFGARCRET